MSNIDSSQLVYDKYKFYVLYEVQYAVYHEIHPTNDVSISWELSPFGYYRKVVSEDLQLQNINQLHDPSAVFPNDFDYLDYDFAKSWSKITNDINFCILNTNGDYSATVNVGSNYEPIATGNGEIEIFGKLNLIGEYDSDNQSCSLTISEVIDQYTDFINEYTKAQNFAEIPTTKTIQINSQIQFEYLEVENTDPKALTVSQFGSCYYNFPVSNLVKNQPAAIDLAPPLDVGWTIFTLEWLRVVVIGISDPYIQKGTYIRQIQYIPTINGLKSFPPDYEDGGWIDLDEYVFIDNVGNYKFARRPFNGAYDTYKTSGCGDFTDPFVFTLILPLNENMRAIGTLDLLNHIIPDGYTIDEEYFNSDSLGFDLKNSSFLSTQVVQRPNTYQSPVSFDITIEDVFLNIINRYNLRYYIDENKAIVFSRNRVTWVFNDVFDITTYQNGVFLQGNNKYSFNLGDVANSERWEQTFVSNRDHKGVPIEYDPKNEYSDSVSRELTFITDYDYLLSQTTLVSGIFFAGTDFAFDTENLTDFFYKAVDGTGDYDYFNFNKQVLQVAYKLNNDLQTVMISSRTPLIPLGTEIKVKFNYTLVSGTQSIIIIRGYDQGGTLRTQFVVPTSPGDNEFTQDVGNSTLNWSFETILGKAGTEEIFKNIEITYPVGTAQVGAGVLSGTDISNYKVALSRLHSRAWGSPRIFRNFYLNNVFSQNNYPLPIRTHNQINLPIDFNFDPYKTFKTNEGFCVLDQAELSLRTQVLKLDLALLDYNPFADL